MARPLGRTLRIDGVETLSTALTFLGLFDRSLCFQPIVAILLVPSIPTISNADNRSEYA
jgi:hypothetical protein